jgi:hypothetical protein
MKKELMNLLLFILFCFVVYFLFRNFNYTLAEGMTTATDASGNTTTASTTSSSNGIAGNAASYGAAIKNQNIKIQDTLLVSKYRSDYETVILNLDDLVNNLMLQASLSVDQSKPEAAIKKIVELNQAKVALNNVMKFIDSSQ